MNILLLCEGNAETRDSFSGTSQSILRHLRKAGHTVFTGDVDLYGRDRLVAAAATFSPNRRRWGARYHLLNTPFQLRSRNARQHVLTHRGHFDLILQIGATFETLGYDDTPLVLYCDSNIRLAQHALHTGQSDAAHLHWSEISDIVERESRIYHGATKIFTISQQLCRSFEVDFGVASDRLRTVFAGPNIDAIPISPEAWVKRRSGTPTVLFIGREFKRKGGDLLLQAFSKVRRQHPNALLQIVGPNALQVNRPGVEVVGFIDTDTTEGACRLQQLFLNANVFCMPTRFEPFGIAYIEAMQFGLPCIGTRAWAVPEIIANDETGYLVPVDNVDALAARLDQLLSDRVLAERMGRAGQIRAQNIFSWEVVVEQILAEVEPLTATQLIPRG